MYLIIHYKQRPDGLKPAMKRRHFNDTKRGNAEYLRLLKDPEVESVRAMTNAQYDAIYLPQAGDAGA